MGDYKAKIKHHEDMITCLKIKSMPAPWGKIFEAIVEMLSAHQKGWEFRVEIIPPKKPAKQSRSNAMPNCRANGQHTPYGDRVMLQNKKGAWLRSIPGYFTFDNTISRLAVKIARDPQTTQADRESYARELNSSANTAFQAMRNKRN